jgi:hypothetical protein
MFSTMHGDEILTTDSENIPTRTWRPRGAARGQPAATAANPPDFL